MQIRDTNLRIPIIQIKVMRVSKDMRSNRGMRSRNPRNKVCTGPQR